MPHLPVTLRYLLLLVLGFQRFDTRRLPIIEELLFLNIKLERTTSFGKFFSTYFSKLYFLLSCSSPQQPFSTGKAKTIPFFSIYFIFLYFLRNRGKNKPLFHLID